MRLSLPRRSGRSPLPWPRPPTSAQYPNQTVRIIVPFSAGSTTDGQARVIADKLGEMWKQQVIVENRPGIAGTASVAKAPADGYTLMLTSNGHTIATVINRNLPYDPVKDFAGVTQVSTVPVGFMVPPDLPARTLKELIALAKEKPGKVNFASAGRASSSYLAGELFKQTAKIDIVHIPHKGAPEAMTSILRGELHLFAASVSTALDLIATKKVGILAVNRPVAALPDVPTVAKRRPARLCLRFLVRRAGPGRDAAGDPQQGQPGYRQDPAAPRRARAHDAPGRGDRHPVAGSVRRRHQERYRALHQDSHRGGRRHQLRSRRVMRAQWCSSPGTPLVMRERPVPEPGAGEILLEVAACGVCRTDLHVVDGELTDPKLPIVPGHEIVGRVAALGAGVAGLRIGERVGVPWLAATCGVCPYCRADRENLCDAPLFTGYTRDGGYATHAVADARFCFPLDEAADPAAIAPWLCAGLIGWRSYRMAGEGRTLGLYGFGAAAHILAQVAAWQGRRVYAFTRAGDAEGQALCPLARRRMGRRIGRIAAGAARCGDHLRAGRGARSARAEGRAQGRPRGVRGHPHVGHPRVPYRLLWEERQVVSVANLTRAGRARVSEPCAEAGIRTEVTRYPLAAANEALADLRAGRLTGAAVLVP